MGQQLADITGLRSLIGVPVPARLDQSGDGIGHLVWNGGAPSLMGLVDGTHLIAPWIFSRQMIPTGETPHGQFPEDDG